MKRHLVIVFIVVAVGSLAAVWYTYSYAQAQAELTPTDPVEIVSVSYPFLTLEWSPTGEKHSFQTVAVRDIDGKMKVLKYLDPDRKGYFRFRESNEGQSEIYTPLSKGK